MKLNFTEIEYLPKFYERSDIKQKFNEVITCTKELLDSKMLSNKEVEDLKLGVDVFKLAGDAYTRNHVIWNIKQMQTYASCRGRFVKLDNANK